MSDSTRSFFVKFSIVFGSIVVLLGGYKVNESYQEYKIKTQHEKAQFYIKDMIQICDFQKLDNNEQDRLERCKDDYEAARMVLLNILDDRIVYWETQKKIESNNFDKIVNIKRNANYWDAQLEYQFNEVCKVIVNRYKEADIPLNSFKKSKDILKEWTPKDADERKSKTDQA
jgi:hypothetical protein